VTSACEVTGTVLSRVGGA